MTANVIMKDGSEVPLLDHLRDAHQKGTQGVTEEFLVNMHKTLHDPDRDLAPEHQHIRGEQPDEAARGRG